MNIRGWLRGFKVLGNMGNVLSSTEETIREIRGGIRELNEYLNGVNEFVNLMQTSTEKGNQGSPEESSEC